MNRTAGFFLALALGGTAAACGAVRRTDGGEGALPEHAVAPAFSAPDQAGHVRTLAEFAGHPIVLYFYPRDGTPGCTREACAFRDAWDRLSATGATVIGVSSDDVPSHRHFADEHHLVFPLLSDGDGHIAQAYGVGRFLGLDRRVTFLIGVDGRVSHVFLNVDPAVHVEEVIRAIQANTPSPAPAAASIRSGVPPLADLTPALLTLHGSAPLRRGRGGLEGTGIIEGAEVPNSGSSPTVMTRKSVGSLQSV